MVHLIWGWLFRVYRANLCICTVQASNAISTKPKLTAFTRSPYKDIYGLVRRTTDGLTTK